MPAPDLLQQLQRTLGDGFLVERELARGGMSRVYLAKDKSLGRDVVVKALSPDLAAEVNFERFSREIRLAGRLQHPHIVPLLSAGESEGVPYYVMPFVDGESLRQKIQRSGELPLDEAVRLMRDVATALDYAHSHGIVHRDIKPENILLSGGTGVVTDFGVAKAVSAATVHDGAAGLTTAGVALGTPSYMAPEQASADPSTDHRADIYAWGVVAYEMLTGAAPFAGRATQAIIAAHIAEPVPDIHRAGVPPRLARLIMRSLSKRPSDRPQSSRELILELDSLTSTGFTSTSSPAGPRSRRALTVWAAVIVALLVIGGFAVRRLGADRATGAVRRIAVLPFANASASRDEEYFADGMSEELGAVLGRVRGVQVASHSSSFAFKGKPIDVKDVGRKLEVDAVLEGRVRRDGNRLRVTAQLTDVANGLSLWSDSYERDSRDVFAVQDEIAHAIASALEVRFAETTAHGTTTVVQGTANAEAYDLYLRGRYFWHKRGAENLRHAIALFNSGTARDPRFARAFAGRASAQTLFVEYADNAPRELDDSALTAAAEALRLDPSVSEAYMARGLVHVHRWEWPEARAAYATAIQLDSTSATAHQWLGELFYALGFPDSAVVEMKKAKALDPLAPVPSVALAYSFYQERRYAESVREAEHGRELAPDLILFPRVLAESYLELGDSAAALREVRKAMNITPVQARTLSIFANVAARTGHRAEALEAVGKLSQMHAGPAAMLIAYLGLGERAKALAALRLLVERRDFTLSQTPLTDPVFDSIRSTAEFRAAANAIHTPRAAGR
ncbi:MAG: protein kinase [Gemmatimonadaceae bacterium]|nr:protein kinase [Gemmatimonadaceae bacterium]